MKHQFAGMLKEGAGVDCVFALQSKEVRSARTGDAYLALELADRSGRIQGVMFRPGSEAMSVPTGSAVRVRGTVTSWRGVRRVSVESLRPTEDYHREDLLPSGRRDRRELMKELRGMIATVQAPPLRAALRTVFGDKEFLRRFLACPGSQGYHHARIGGLAEHTLAVTALCGRLAETYEHADADLLVTAALLHDVGKVEELALGPSVAYTDAGILLGHVVLGERLLRESIARAGAPVPTAVLLQLSHIIFSHHGELEWGAPKRPATLEALILHHADSLDAKVSGFIDAAQGASLAEERWTDSCNLFRRPLWAPRPVEDDRPAPSPQQSFAACG